MSNCKACGAGIWFIRTRAGKATPVDEEPVPFVPDENGPERYLKEDGIVHKGRRWVHGQDDFYDLGYVSHFATCPQAERFRRK